MQEQIELQFKSSQSERILAALKSGRKLTPLIALQDFGCLRLGGRIFDLRKLGYKIQSEMIDVGNGKHVACYHLEQ